MSSVKVLRISKKENKEGVAPLYLRIIKDRKIKYISLGIKTKAHEWLEEKQRVIPKFRNSGYVNAFISQKVADAEAVALTMERKSKNVTSRKIKEQIMGKAPSNFFAYADKYIATVEHSDKYGMYRRVKSVINKLKAYHGDSPLMFDDITYSFLKSYEDHLSKNENNATNTITSNLKIIRKIINDAIKDGIITYNDNPFFKFKLKTEPSKREFLTEEELNRIEELQLPEDLKLNDHRNAYVFATYAGGLRISDILQLKWENFDGAHINIVIHKTRQQLSIMLPNKALEIINIYKREDSQPEEFIFPFLRNDKDYSLPKVLHLSIASATTLANNALNSIAVRAKIKKHISFHTSRHTFATRALRKGVRIEYVSKLLGHSNIKETQVYAKIVNEELDKAMEVFN